MEYEPSDRHELDVLPCRRIQPAVASVEPTCNQTAAKHLGLGAMDAATISRWADSMERMARAQAATGTKRDSYVPITPLRSALVANRRMQGGRCCERPFPIEDDSVSQVHLKVLFKRRVRDLGDDALSYPPIFF